GPHNKIMMTDFPSIGWGPCRSPGISGLLYVCYLTTVGLLWIEIATGLCLTSDNGDSLQVFVPQPQRLAPQDIENPSVKTLKAVNYGRWKGPTTDPPVSLKHCRNGLGAIAMLPHA